MVANLRHKIGMADAENDDVWKFQLSEGIFQKWTFINVHFRKPEVDFWKKQCNRHSEHNALNRVFNL